eukprot:1417327-Rhodomonas_salina.1
MDGTTGYYSYNIPGTVPASTYALAPGSLALTCGMLLPVMLEQVKTQKLLGGVRYRPPCPLCGVRLCRWQDHANVLQLLASLPGTALRATVMSGTDLAYSASCLRACYAMSGTDLACAMRVPRDVRD